MPLPPWCPSWGWPLPSVSAGAAYGYILKRTHADIIGYIFGIESWCGKGPTNRPNHTQLSPYKLTYKRRTSTLAIKLRVHTGGEVTKVPH